jgi:tetratricopeptide (TPR) repeat protein
MTVRSAARPVPAPVSRRLRYGAVLVLAGVLVFANGLGGPFIIDDQTAIESNQRIRRLSPLSEALSPPRDTPVAGRPLVNLSFALNYAISELDARDYRVTNLAIHLLVALVLFGLVRRTLELDGIAAGMRIRSREVAFACALIWTIHPLQTEVVNYVTQRTTSLMGLMYLLTLYCSLRGVGWRHGRWQAAAVLACAAGMACKESMVTAPVMVALYDRIFVYPTFREALHHRRRLYAGLAATWLVLASLLASAPRSTVGFRAGVDAWTYLLNQATVIVDYLRLTFLPRALVIDYGLPRPLALSDVLVPSLAVIGLALVTLVALKRWPRAGFLGAWFFITLAPTSSFVPIATEVGAERRMYLPLAAIVVLVVCGGFMLAAARRLSTIVPIGACAVVCMLLAAGTLARNREYRSRLALAEATVERRPHGRNLLRLGVLLLDAGRRPEALDYVHRAKEANAVGSRFVLGTEYLVEGRLEAGSRELSDFVRRHPEHRNVVQAREMLGRVYLAQGRLDDASGEFAEILRIVPNHLLAHESMGDLLLARRRAGEALPHLEFVASRRTGDVTALGKLGTALAASGRLDPAIVVLTKAVAADPRHSQARKVLGRVLAGQGRFEEAIEQLKHAVQLAPDDAGARRDLEAAHAELDRRRW